MTTQPNHSDDEIDAILDKIADYLPDECSSLNHNDLPETKAAIQAYVQQEVVKGRIEELEQLHDWAFEAFEPNSRSATVLLEIDDRLDALKAEGADHE